ncbi:ATP-dependent metallopeptidase FtsH/Yme1/Tma family protein, partial [Klebsiella pneumoniae]|nr:ATP-dependent metallopeptidase FtsH/Yme1/Tma family protein [Klebsiella pneumoniae]
DNIPYSTFLDKVQAGEVKAVNIAVGSGVVTGTLSGEGKFRTNVPNDPQLIPTLRDKGVTINAKPEDGPNIWAYILYQSL